MNRFFRPLRAQQTSVAARLVLLMLLMLLVVVAIAVALCGVHLTLPDHPGPAEDVTAIASSVVGLVQWIALLTILSFLGLRVRFAPAAVVREPSFVPGYLWSADTARSGPSAHCYPLRT